MILLYMKQSKIIVLLFILISYYKSYCFGCLATNINWLVLIFLLIQNNKE